MKLHWDCKGYNKRQFHKSKNITKNNITKNTIFLFDFNISIVIINKMFYSYRHIYVTPTPPASSQTLV